MQIKFNTSYIYTPNFKQIKLSKEEQERTNKLFEDIKKPELKHSSFSISKEIYNLFIPHLNKEIEDKLKNNLYLLKQKFEEEGIKYNNIDSTLSEDSELDVDKILNTLKDNTNIGEESNV